VTASCGITAVDFEHEPDADSRKISDATAERDLPPEPHAQLLAAQQLPQALFGGRRRSAHARRALHDECFMSSGTLRLTHDFSASPECARASPYATQAPERTHPLGRTHEVCAIL
jgi:hypothetical protein